MEKYIIVTTKEWNIRQYYLSKPKKGKNWYIISDPKKLTFKYINSIKPKYIFFPHWSKKVKKKIISNFECIGFHETNVPYGRGGSPIQNLIIRNHKKTFVTAIQMIDKLDAGPVYLKSPLLLNGSAQHIFERASKIIFKMIKIIIKNNFKLIAQKGKVVKFKRRTVKQSVIPKNITSLKELFNRIRMLDAHSYPTAFINYGNLKIEFTNAKINKNNLDVNANLRFTLKNK